MSRVSVIALLIGPVWFSVSASQADDGAVPANGVISLETGWRYSLEDVGGEESSAFDDSDWRPARVPHMGHELSDKSARSENVIWLRRKVELPRLGTEMRVLLQVTQATNLKCWLNGQSAAKLLLDQSTLMADVTDLVQDGENVLVLQAKLPGIQGFVRLHVVPQLHLDPRGLMVDFPGWTDGPTEVRIRTDVENHSDSARTIEVRATVVDQQGNRLATASSPPITLAKNGSQSVTLQTTPISDPPLWSPETPRLCSVSVELLEHQQPIGRQESKFGFRRLHFEPEGPLVLNGKAYRVRGVVYVRPRTKRFSDRSSLWEYEVGLLKGMGVNFVRFSRSIDQGFYDVCDREGLFVAAPIHRRTQNEATEKDVANTVRELCNHPSVLTWYTNGEGKNAPTARIMSRTSELLRANDPSRPVLCCELGWRAPGSVGLVDTDIAGQGNYTGWYEGTLEHIGPYMDDYRTLLRERYGRPLSILISNFGAAGDFELHTASPIRNDYSHEYLTAYHQRFYAEIERRPWVAGGFIFCFRDLEADQPIPRHTWKGMLGQNDRKKDAYYFYQSRWTTEPMVHITQKSWSSRVLWPAGEKRQVEVFSNGDLVELFQDGKSLGTRSEEDNRFVWDVTYRKGNNSLRAVAGKGEASVEDTSNFTVRFRPPPANLRLVSQPADGNSSAGSSAARLVWEDVPGADRYSVYVGTEPEFDVRQGRLLATLPDHSLRLKRIVEPRYYKVVAEAGSVSGLSSHAVGRQPGSLQWKFTNSGWLLSSPALADLTGDGHVEIVIGSYNGSVYALRSDGSLLWSFDAIDPVLASPVVVALGAGESPSVVVNSTKALYVLASDGSLRWKREGIRQFDRSARSPSVADLDGDGRQEIIVGSDTGKLMVFSADGQLQWQYRTAGPGNQGLNPTTCVVIDLPDDAGKALCFATDDGNLYLLDARGKELWKHDLGIGDSAVGSPPNFLTPAASPLHNPGPIRIIAGGRSMQALDTAGNVLWERADLWKQGVFGGFGGFPQVSNLYRDGDRQVVLVSQGMLHVLDHQGRDIWSYQLPDPRDYFLQPPVSADLDADGEPDLVAGTRATNLVALSSRGELLWNFKTEDEITGCPAIADINQDGIVDVVFGSRDGSLYVISADQAPAFAQESLTYRGSRNREASYDPVFTPIFGPLESSAVSQQHQDVPYGSDPLQKLDAFLPAADDPTPVIIEFHGGGWRRGHKGQSGSYRGLLEKALESGMAVVSANYRLTPRDVWPASAEDAVRVVQFVRFKADEWNIDPQRVVLIGGSAGAHLSLWVGLHDDLADSESRDPVRRQSSRVSGIIDCWGPTDLAHMELRGRAREALPQLFGSTPEEWETPRIQALVREVSPANYVSADDPPVLMIHTEDEGDLPDDPHWKTANPHSPLFGLWLKQKLDAVGVPAEIIIDTKRGDHPEWVERAFNFLQEVFR